MRKHIFQEKPTKQKVQPFFDLSTSENAVKSFLEAIVLKDNEKAVECWSKKYPEFFVALIVSTMQKSFEEAMQKDPESKLILQNPEVLKFGLEKNIQL